MEMESTSLSHNPALSLTPPLETAPLKMTWCDKIILRCFSLFSIAKIANHLIKIAIASIALIILSQFATILHLGKVHDYAGIMAQLAIAYQIIRSSRHSLLLPTLACGVGLIIASNLAENTTLLGFSPIFFGHMAAVGLLGLLVSTFVLIEDEFPLSLQILKQWRSLK